jgi:hypothetical protein
LDEYGKILKLSANAVSEDIPDLEFSKMGLVIRIMQDQQETLISAGL